MHASWDRQEQIRTPIESTLFYLQRSSMYDAGVAAVGFGGYLALGYGAVTAGIFTPAYQFASFTDPIFTVTALAVGLLLSVSTGTLTLLTLLTGTDDANAEFVILMSMVGFGFSIGLVRITVRSVMLLFPHGILLWSFLWI